MNRYKVNPYTQNQNNIRGEYDTTIVLIDSQRGSEWTGYGLECKVAGVGTGTSNSNFVSILNNPLVLDNNYEYVCCITKASFDISNYTTDYISINVNCDQIAFQYNNSGLQQILHKTIPVKNTGNLTTGYFTPFSDEPKTLVWRYLNPSNKVISRITFNITDSDGFPLNSTDPTKPTQLQLAIKKVVPNQQY